MEGDCRILYKGGTGELVEKKSRFIAAIHPARTEEEALGFVESERKKYWDAKHHCYAYIVGEMGAVRRFSDDGEPGGTAGKPMLEVLAGGGLCDVVAVVTRYFGGTLLGTGGLVRAYSGAVKKGLKASVAAVRKSGIRLRIDTDYAGLGKIQYILGRKGLQALDVQYTDKVTLHVLASDEDAGKLQSEIIEGTGGKAKITQEERCRFAVIEGKPVILDTFA